MFVSSETWLKHTNRGKIEFRFIVFNHENPQRVYTGFLEASKRETGCILSVLQWRNHLSWAATISIANKLLVLCM